MENVIDSVYPPARNDTEILWKSWRYPGSIEREREREGCTTRRFTNFIPFFREEITILIIVI